jgi:spermidine synthase
MPRPLDRLIILLLFCCSGLAGLIYEVTWARSLGLVFGASHLAVATVLAVYMGGQALGSALLGKRADRTQRPLRLYGFLEIGIGLSAAAFLGAMKVYPHVYGPLARLGGGAAVYLTTLRTLFAVVAMAVPTTLMGGTLPVITRFVVARRNVFARDLSLLYAMNTLGAVAGAAAAGFVLLKGIGVTATLLVGASVSATVGAAAVLLDRRLSGTLSAPAPLHTSPTPPSEGRELATRLTVLGIGVSGFCALGYEVLWTRMLTLVVGTSVYAFTIMLLAFLAGIGAGSHAFAIVRGPWTRAARGATAYVFGATQLAIGLSALAVTVLMRYLPNTTSRLQDVLVGVGTAEFTARTVASAGVAFAYMFVPAFFMGAAFPAAGAVVAPASGQEGRAVGRLLTVNTVGAILGSVASGFALIRLFGIERSLQMLVVVNVAVGLAVTASIGAPRWARVAVPTLALALLVARAAYPGWGRVWDQKFFATYINNTRAVDTPEQVREALANTDVLYYFEGSNETVSAVKVKGGVQSFIVNGRPEASTHPRDVQLQKALGHVPMLLHPNPRRVFILGTGTGMTLGAASIHPELERLVLGEIEEGMLGVARTFNRWNNDALDSPKLHIVFNDGRNFLTTTDEKFDVISADPVHPWSGGAGYLYTREYFRSVAGRLAPGGIACQWLPLYELTVRDVKTVVRTFSESFQHVMVWLTYYDAILVGSNEPIVIDESALARRLSTLAGRGDLAAILVGTPDDFLSFFLMGTSGARAFGQGGDLNTDDNLVLEFSAPESQGLYGMDGWNVLALAPFREDLTSYLPRATGDSAPLARERWGGRLATSRLFDQVHGRFLVDPSDPAVAQGLAVLRSQAPAYAPLRFLLDQKMILDRSRPALVDAVEFPHRAPDGAVTISAIRQYMGTERVLVSFVDNSRHEIYGQRYLDGSSHGLERKTQDYVAATFASLRRAAAHVGAGDGAPPPRLELSAALHGTAKEIVGQLPSASH